MSESTAQDPQHDIWMSVEEVVVQEFIERLKADSILSDESLGQLRGLFRSNSVTEDSLLEILRQSARNGP